MSDCCDMGPEFVLSLLETKWAKNFTISLCFGNNKLLFLQHLFWSWMLLIWVNFITRGRLLFTRKINPLLIRHFDMLRFEQVTFLCHTQTYSRPILFHILCYNLVVWASVTWFLTLSTCFDDEVVAWDVLLNIVVTIIKCKVACMYPFLVRARRCNALYSRKFGLDLLWIFQSKLDTWIDGLSWFYDLQLFHLRSLDPLKILYLLWLLHLLNLFHDDSPTVG